MRKREPHGADLLPSRREAVENASGHDQVRPRIVVSQCQASAIVVDGCEGSRKRDTGGNIRRDFSIREERGTRCRAFYFQSGQAPSLHFA